VHIPAPDGVKLYIIVFFITFARQFKKHNMHFNAPAFLRHIFPAFVWSFEGETQRVFLTFDDGPRPEVTPWVLDELDKWQAKATFFCLGKNVEMFPDLFREIKARGHATGNHTYSHIKGWGMDTGLYIRDVDFANDLIGSNLFRPPYARIGPNQARMLGERYRVIMWDVLSRDYSRRISGRRCTRNVIKYVKPGSIVVFHDSVKSARNLWEALPRTLHYIYEQGWLCKPIEL
jgi:peptidoglycan/xylan/chitin deacetylase (PgdA/CDA1 family)